MEQLVGHFPFVVEPFTEDFTGRLSWFFLGNHLLRCASRHAETHGFGLEDVKRDHRGWVLSRLVVEMNQMPCSGEHYNIDTWVAKIYRQFTDRLFSIADDNGKVFGYAYSVWALIDYDTRQPLEFSQLDNESFVHAVQEREIPIQGPGRVRVKSKEPVRNCVGRYSDLDINGHVNSIRYLQMILDLFTEEIHDRHQVVKRLEVAYCNESYCGDQLNFYRENGEDGRSCVEIRKDNGEVVVKAAVVLK